jgi:hypothetical protein
MRCRRPLLVLALTGPGVAPTARPGELWGILVSILLTSDGAVRRVPGAAQKNGASHERLGNP